MRTQVLSSNATKIFLGEGEDIVVRNSTVLYTRGALLTSVYTKKLVEGIMKRVQGKQGAEWLLFHNRSGEAEIVVSNIWHGVQKVVRLDNVPIYCVKNSLLGFEPGISYEIKGTRNINNIQNIEVMSLNGVGSILIGAIGDFINIDLADGQSITADASRVVAFENSVHYEFGYSVGVQDVILGGKGFHIINFTGAGRVLMQDMTPLTFAEMLGANIGAVLSNEIRKARGV